MAHKPLPRGGGEQEDTGVAGSRFTSRQENVNQDTILVIRENGMLEDHFGIERPLPSLVQLPFLRRGNRIYIGITNRSMTFSSSPIVPI